MLLFALAGLPVTHDGFFHIAWIESFNHALYHEGVIARWYAEAFGGVGSASFVFYPPLFRLLSLPFGAFTESASLLTSGAIATVLVLHAVAAWRFLLALPLTPRTRSLGLLLAVLNPYLLVNIWIRGAWSEALALALLWCLALGLWRLLHDETRRGTWLVAGAFAGLLICHHPTALLALYAAVPWACALAWTRRWAMLRRLGIAAFVGALLASFHLLPVLLDQHAIRLLTGERLYPMQWTQWQPDSLEFARALSWIWLWLAAVALASCTVWRRTAVPRMWIVANALVLVLAVVMMLPLAADVHAFLPQLGRIQFPWRWMAIATPAAICLILVFAQGDARARGLAWLLGLAGLASGAPLLREIAFAPAAFETLDAMYRCGREQDDCSRFDAIEPLRDRFGTLRYLGQHESHHGPWVDAQGRLWRSDVYDYLPRPERVETWDRTELDRRFMPPFPQRPGVGIEPPSSARVFGEQRRVHRWVVDLEVEARAWITLERLRYPGWEVRVQQDDGEFVRVDPDPDSLYYRIELPPGRQRVQLRQIGSPAERAGELLSLGAALVLGFGLWLSRSRAFGAWRRKGGQG